MNILFIHQAFPGPFHALARTLAQEGHTVLAMTMQQPGITEWHGVRLIPYGALRGSSPQIHPWLADFETKVIRGESCLRAALQLKAEGFTPDAIVAHPGWGESLFIKDVWPDAKLGLYFEWAQSLSDSGFDPEFPVAEADEACRLRLRNLNNALHFEAADAGIAPTDWQAARFPERFQKQTSVIPNGIDTALIAPNPDISLTLGGNQPLTRRDEIVTFMAPALEPCQGYHSFMRALPQILRRRPTARILIAGGDTQGFNPLPPTGSWKEIFAAEVRPQIDDADWARVHFVGPLTDTLRIAVLQLTSVHVCLAYPSIPAPALSEAMSVGATIIASDTPPLTELIRDDETGKVVNFFDSAALADTVCGLLEAPDTRTQLGGAARDFAIRHLDLETAVLPRQRAWVDTLTQASPHAPSLNETLKDELGSILSLIR